MRQRYSDYAWERYSDYALNNTQNILKKCKIGTKKS